MSSLCPWCITQSLFLCKLVLLNCIRKGLNLHTEVHFIPSSHQELKWVWLTHNSPVASTISHMIGGFFFSTILHLLKIWNLQISWLFFSEQLLVCSHRCSYFTSIYVCFLFLLIQVKNYWLFYSWIASSSKAMPVTLETVPPRKHLRIKMIIIKRTQFSVEYLLVCVSSSVD